MAFEINDHVERLHRYLPFDVSFDQIYEENRTARDSLEIETRALRYLAAVLGDEPTLIVLTGDAGHGKTHLCNRILREHLGYDEAAARRAVREACDGRRLEPLELRQGARALRIFKDFSEPTPDAARDLLTAALADTTCATIVCVNEGRLRSILAAAEDTSLHRLRSAFLNSFQSGLASDDGRLHIVNLNYQSVAAEPDSIAERVLSGESRMWGWLDQRRWNICDSCDAKSGCPINRNATLLGGQTGAVRRRRLKELMALMERLGTVITIREILMALAYALTGGLRCRDVRADAHRQGWQHEYMFYSTLFFAPRSIGRDKLARIPVLKELAALDPGRLAERRVDERLINNPDGFKDAGCELLFTRRIGSRTITIDATRGIDDIVGEGRNSDERRAEAAFTRDVVSALRRRDFFEHSDGEDFEARRLGVSHYGDFQFLLSDENDVSRRVKIKNRLIAGLHTLQGLRLPSSEATLHLVDPAFGRSMGQAAIISRKISSNQIRLLRQSDGWRLVAGEPHALRNAVDWIERSILLLVELGDGVQRQHALDLLAFDCVMRAAAGYLPETFYAPDIRRILNFLGLLAERSRQDAHDSISIMVHGALHTVALEEGGVIVVGGG
ncbi:hypothetical protein [Falsiroseomonas oryzae]|uniref:hypothetical protein n=1 Tax=Falsiroseomonas oryzae TaxID=2766473 RepID=UPI0022EA558A|nr:hypothetical protein [Roseomonas sp. MO-31]